MNAKERKKEKRRAERDALGTTGTTEHTAQDAELWGEPYVPEELLDGTSKGPPEVDEDQAATSQDAQGQMAEVSKECTDCITGVISDTFALNGVNELDEYEHRCLVGLVTEMILPKIVNGMHALRRARQDAKVQGVFVEMDWKFVVDDGVHTQSQGDALEHGLQQGAAQLETTDADNANGLAGGAGPDVMWESATRKATDKGGDEETVHKAAVKIYRAMKRKQKAKDQKLIVVA